MQDVTCRAGVRSEEMLCGTVGGAEGVARLAGGEHLNTSMRSQLDLHPGTARPCREGLGENLGGVRGRTECKCRLNHPHHVDN